MRRLVLIRPEHREHPPDMPTTVKGLLAAARAAVPAITPEAAADLVKTADALIVDV
jgi:hypothetical protein